MLYSMLQLDKSSKQLSFTTENSPFTETSNTTHAHLPNVRTFRFKMKRDHRSQMLLFSVLISIMRITGFVSLIIHRFNVLLPRPLVYDLQTPHWLHNPGHFGHFLDRNRLFTMFGPRLVNSLHCTQWSNSFILIIFDIFVKLWPLRFNE